VAGIAVQGDRLVVRDLLPFPVDLGVVAPLAGQRGVRSEQRKPCPGMVEARGRPEVEVVMTALAGGAAGTARELLTVRASVAGRARPVGLQTKRRLLGPDREETGPGRPGSELLVATLAAQGAVSAVDHETEAGVRRGIDAGGPERSEVVAGPAPRGLRTGAARLEP